MFDKYGYNPFRSQVTFEFEAIWGDYPRPGHAMGKFIASEGIRYQDFQGNTWTIPSYKIAGFFKELRSRPLCHQAAFAKIFQSNKRKFENYQVFEECLTELGLATKIDYYMLLLAEKIHEIKPHKLRSESNETFTEVHKQLLKVLEEFEKEIENIGISLHSSEDEVTAANTALAKYIQERNQILEKVYNEYQHHVDGYNLVLNVFCMLTLIGLIVLLCKNIGCHGSNYEHWQLFQFADEHLSLIDALRALGGVKLEPFVDEDSDSELALSEEEDDLEFHDAIEGLLPDKPST